MILPVAGCGMQRLQMQVDLSFKTRSFLIVFQVSGLQMYVQALVGMGKH